MSQIRKGYFTIRSPVSGRASHLPATPDDVHTIIFWSKNFGPLIREDAGRVLVEMGYHLFFNFTLNSEDPLLEPHVPPLKDRLEQLRILAGRFAPESITWRFDPVCFYTDRQGRPRNNLRDFMPIARVAETCGVTRCVTSFADLYPKVLCRARSIPGLSFVDPPLEKKAAILLRMEQALAGSPLSLSVCCEREVVEALPAGSRVEPASCVSGRLLRDLFGGRVSLAKDRGQRVKSGCGCTKSVDVGSYDKHPCGHRCLYCYG